MKKSKVCLSSSQTSSLCGVSPSPPPFISASIMILLSEFATFKDSACLSNCNREWRHVLTSVPRMCHEFMDNPELSDAMSRTDCRNVIFTNVCLRFATTEYLFKISPRIARVSTLYLLSHPFMNEPPTCISHVSAFTSIKTLGLHDIRDAMTLSTICTLMPQLESLFISVAPFGHKLKSYDLCVIKASNLPVIRHLSIEISYFPPCEECSCSFTGGFASSLASLTTLEYLKLNGVHGAFCSGIQQKGSGDRDTVCSMKHVLSSLSQLTTLICKCNSWINDDLLQCISTGASANTLTTLDITVDQPSGYTSKGLKFLFALTCLETLRVSRNFAKRLGDDALQSLSLIRSLTRLDLEYWNSFEFTVDNTQPLLSLPRLTHLNMHGRYACSSDVIKMLLTSSILRVLGVATSIKDTRIAPFPSANYMSLIHIFNPFRFSY